MANVKITGNSYTVTSSLAKAAFDKFKKYTPTALTLKDTDKNEIFKLGFGMPSISEFGVSYTSVNAAGKMYVTFAIPTNVGDRKGYVTDLVAAALPNLTAIEAELSEALAGLETDIAAIENSITIED